ncbi:MAG TPA: nuclear transport factor 2 family protein [Pyrinomonadaceae bacterium]|jgi:hypothetical protein
MKRLLALAALALLAASACTTTTDNTNTGAGNTNAAANANAAATTATPAAAGPTQADIEAKERAVYDAIKAKNWDAFGAMLTDDFVIVSGGGVETKAGMLEGMKKYELTDYTITDARLVKVDADLAVITYTTTSKGTYDGKPAPDKPIRASSAWVNRGGKWLAAYHQETEIAETPAGAATPAAGASPAASPASSPSASPAASPAAPATATDAEKAVWEAIKTKNSDAFAGFMLPEAVEVEPEGVFDKAASVKGVMMFDASKHTLSDFKEIRLDADSALVTYKGTGPERGKTVTMYHTTIWNNRGGQWKAAFHQGSNASEGGM